MVFWQGAAKIHTTAITLLSIPHRQTLTQSNILPDLDSPLPNALSTKSPLPIDTESELLQYGA